MVKIAVVDNSSGNVLHIIVPPRHSFCRFQGKSEILRVQSFAKIYPPFFSSNTINFFDNDLPKLFKMSIFFKKETYVEKERHLDAENVSNKFLKSMFSFKSFICTQQKQPKKGYT